MAFRGKGAQAAVAELREKGILPGLCIAVDVTFPRIIVGNDYLIEHTFMQMAQNALTRERQQKELLKDLQTQTLNSVNVQDLTKAIFTKI